MEANIEIAQALFKQNKYQEAIDVCNKILANDSNEIDALKWIAKSFLSTKRVDDSRLYLNKALNIKPEVGMFKLFPSYAWHGTIPYAASYKRVSI